MSTMSLDDIIPVIELHINVQKKVRVRDDNITSSDGINFCNVIIENENACQ